LCDASFGADFDMVFAQYHRHPEFKSLGSDGQHCKADTLGLLKRYPVKASSLHLIGKETVRAWGQAEDVSTLLPSLVHYDDARNETSKHLQTILRRTSLNTLRKQTGLSKNTIRRARRGLALRRKSLQALARGNATPSPADRHLPTTPQASRPLHYKKD
jgi:hypothetical protein